MASSGSKTVSVTSYDSLVFSWSASQNINSNYSTVSWKLQLKSTANGRISSSSSKDWSVTVNGTKYSGTNTVGISASSTKTLASGSTRVNHNSDGSKTFSYSFSQEFAITFSGSYIGTKSGSGRGTLNTIPRATTPTLSVSSQEFGKSVTINTPRASSSFTHTLQYDFVDGTYHNIATGVGTSYSWTIPTSLISKIPNTASSWMTIKCITYNGSTKIGEKTVRLDVTVPASYVPTISTIATSESVTEIATKFGAYIMGKSKPTVTITAAGVSGSTIKSYSTTVGDKTYSGGSFTIDELTSSGTVAIKTTVTDSRGRTATKTVNITVLDYSPPVITAFSAFRCDASGAAIDDGDRLNVTRKWEITSLNNKNDNSWTLEYRKNSSESFTTLASGTGYSFNDSYITSNVFDVDYAYELKVTISDYWNSVSLIVDIPTAFTLVDYNASGRSIAFGGVSTRAANESAADFKLDMYDKFGARINNGLAMYTGSADKAIDPDTTIEELVLTDKNTPIGQFMYITTVFYGDKTETANRAQTAIPYSSQTAGMWFRNYYNGAWSAWRSMGDDSGWITPTLSSEFVAYSDGQEPEYRKKNGRVEIRGAVKAKAQFADSYAEHTIFTLPEGFRPNKIIPQICQGSMRNIWLLQVRDNGNVTASRYRVGDTNGTISTSTWLIMHVDFSVD